MSNVKERIGTRSIRLSSKGQLVIPKIMRDLIGLDYGDIVKVGISKKTPAKKVITIEKIPTILELAGTFKAKNNQRPLKSEDVRRYMEENYERK